MEILRNHGRRRNRPEAEVDSPIRVQPVIYSLSGLEGHVGQPKPVQLTFERNFPDAIRDKVRANWKKWGLPELNDPNRNPTWKYFETTGVGETGRRQR